MRLAMFMAASAWLADAADFLIRAAHSCQVQSGLTFAGSPVSPTSRRPCAITAPGLSVPLMSGVPAPRMEISPAKSDHPPLQQIGHRQPNFVIIV